MCREGCGGRGVVGRGVVEGVRFDNVLLFQLIDSEGERDDLFKTLSQVRKKAAKFGSEMNDLKLLLEAQQARNAELEKRQRK